MFTLAACGRIGFDAHAGDGSQPGDDASGDVIAMSCLAAGGGDDFSDGVPCMPWGRISAGTGTTVTEANGELIITPKPNTATQFGVCESSSMLPFTNAGVFVEVATTLPFGQTYFTVFDGYTLHRMYVNVDTIVVETECPYYVGAMVPFDPVAMRWWRIRPGGAGVLYETSPDASHWTKLATIAISILPRVTVDVQATQFQLLANPGSARFAGVNICP